MSGIFDFQYTAGKRRSKVFAYTRLGIFIAIVVLEVIIFFLNLRENGKFFGVPKWPIILGIEVVFTVSVCLQTFALHRFRYKIACYVVDFLAQFALTALIGRVYLLAIYILILSEYYISTERFLDSFIMGIASLVIYVVTYAFAASQDVWQTVIACFSELLILTVHFLLVNFALYSYDSKQSLSESLRELDEKNRKLQQAYDELAEVTLLQERQRIAKDIHDTAGHSITTVIMQTEAAKLLVDEDPAEAKRRIVAANLQAKNALEELRRSVHLLAGDVENVTLQSDLQRIINDSCDGTDVVIRSSVENIDCSQAKRRFLSNSLKEGIANGLRHGRATAFYFELYCRDGSIHFLLSDNGAGVDVPTMHLGFGLKGMRKRAEGFGGKMYISSPQGEGFEIHIVLPTDEKKSNETEEKENAD